MTWQWTRVFLQQPPCVSAGINRRGCRGCLYWGIALLSRTGKLKENNHDSLTCNQIYHLCVSRLCHMGAIDFDDHIFFSDTRTMGGSTGTHCLHWNGSVTRKGEAETLIITSDVKCSSSFGCRRYRWGCLCPSEKKKLSKMQYIHVHKSQVTPLKNLVKIQYMEFVTLLRKIQKLRNK